MKIKSKFPGMEPTIFTKISELSAKYEALNFGQGFPSFGPNEFILERLNFYTTKGINQYAPMTGMPKLRQSIQKIQKDIYGVEIDCDSEITVTSGATEAIFCAISTVVNSGDEVIVFDPCYDSYVPNIELNGGKAIRINLQSDFSIDWSLVEKAISSKTKGIIINSPHNPSGKMMTQSDLDQLWDLVKEKEIFIISDEVYQHIIFDGRKHLSPFNDERMRNRTFAISSFGKTFHVTGWKVGYCLACENLSKEFRKIHQYITFCTLGSTQLAVSDMIDEHFEDIVNLGKFYEEKRDIMKESLKDSPLKLLDVEGSYFQLIDYSSISELNDREFCEKLIKEYKFATIPIAGFYQSPPKDQRILRLCFAKDNEILKSVSFPSLI